MARRTPAWRGASASAGGARAATATSGLSGARASPACATAGVGPTSSPRRTRSVSYTHLRAHETSAHL
eukprot:12086163-Alexandrium_andersonii.AAC.1